ncbi:sulfatase-like hydrolase/transferase [Labilibacter marinus]|uniref:sulfatase-like hydrolase/transferase n=1 Tax=Labilibacter marinus TaxID=1477105 RepID=UPI00094F72EF|nr:sulfatase-like hydrolase/transferase [Labilibacter marinus]
MQYLKRYGLLLLSTIMIFSCTNIKKGEAKQEEKPNVIIIFPDQYRQFSLGFWSQGDNAKYIHGKPDPVNTPALDKLANDGVVFSRAMSNFPLCSPYRGMLLSGQYPTKNGLTANCRKDREVGIKVDGKAIANVFTQGGYETAYFGKCHWQKTVPMFDEKGTYHGTTEAPGGHYINRYDTYVPPGGPRLGYKYFFQTLRDTHKDPLCYSNDPKAIEGFKEGELYQPKRFSAEFESEALLNYLDNTHGQRDMDKPFFVTWSLNPPHNPWDEESTDMKFFPQYTNQGNIEIDDLLLRGNADKEVGEYAPYYFANVSAVDYYIGLVLDKLEKMGVADNTIIVFSSDHGEMLGSHGHKGKPYPESEAFNIPFILKWGKELNHRVEDLILSVPDVMPTLLALVGLEDIIPATVQGTNFASIIKDPESNITQRPNAVLYFDYNQRGLYLGDYTFVVKTSNGVDFKEAFYYDNVKDPYQLHKIKGDQMNLELVEEWKKILVKQLIAIEDKWAIQKICEGYLEY